MDKKFVCYIQEGKNVYTPIVYIHSNSVNGVKRIIKERLQDKEVFSYGYDRICHIKEYKPCKLCAHFGDKVTTGENWRECKKPKKIMYLNSGVFEPICSHVSPENTCADFKELEGVKT